MAYRTRLERNSAREAWMREHQAEKSAAIDAGAHLDAGVICGFTFGRPLPARTLRQVRRAQRYRRQEARRG